MYRHFVIHLHKSSLLTSNLSSFNPVSLPSPLPVSTTRLHYPSPLPVSTTRLQYPSPLPVSTTRLHYPSPLPVSPPLPLALFLHSPPNPAKISHHSSSHLSRIHNVIIYIYTNVNPSGHYVPVSQWLPE